MKRELLIVEIKSRDLAAGTQFHFRMRVTFPVAYRSSNILFSSNFSLSIDEDFT